MAYAKTRGPVILYDIDFSTKTPQNLLSNGDHVIDGYTWTVNNASAATVLEINSNGLVTTTVSGTANYGDGVRTSALIYSPIINWIPNLDFRKLKYVKLLTKVALTNANANFKFFKIGFEVGTLPASTSAAHDLGFANGIIEMATQINPTATTQYTGRAAGSNNVIGIVWTPPFNFDYVYGAYSGGWPTSLSTNSIWGGQPVAISSFISSQMRIVMTTAPNTAGTGVTSTITNFRIEAEFR